MIPRRSCAAMTATTLLFLASAIQLGASMCFFPAEFQGEFLTQSTATPGRVGGPPRVSYSQVTITPDSIPVWGVCHKRIGNKVVLMDTTGGASCVRCFQLQLLSRNVLQVYTEGLAKCYTNEEAAIATCPNVDTIASGRSIQFLLFKTKGYNEEETITQEYCPLNGRFRFTYNVNDGTENSVECSDPASELSNCPYGFGLSVQFRRCSFGNLDMSFQCLGDWEGPANQRYLALLDTQATVGGEQRPRYRCALYREEAGTGRIHLAFSSDSTCQNQLRSATDGYEIMTLTAVSAPAWPHQVQSSTCRFPDWSQGHWEHLYVEGSNLVYQDLRNFKTYTGRCIGSTRGDSEHFVVYARTQCGDELYNCLWMKMRGINVMEFQMGLHPSATYNESLCLDSRQFLDRIWITQGRTDITLESPCPVAGEYTGMIPDGQNLCAKLSSDCNNPEIMFYSVADCYETAAVYEGSEGMYSPPNPPPPPQPQQPLTPSAYRRPAIRRDRTRTRNSRSARSENIVRITDPRPATTPTSEVDQSLPETRQHDLTLETSDSITTITTLSSSRTPTSTTSSTSASITSSTASSTTSTTTTTSKPTVAAYDPFVYNGYHGRREHPPVSSSTTTTTTTTQKPDTSYVLTRDRDPVLAPDPRIVHYNDTNSTTSESPTTTSAAAVFNTQESYDPYAYNGYTQGQGHRNRQFGGSYYDTRSDQQHHYVPRWYEEQSRPYQYDYPRSAREDDYSRAYYSRDMSEKREIGKEQNLTRPQPDSPPVTTQSDRELNARMNRVPPPSVISTQHRVLNADDQAPQPISQIPSSKEEPQPKRLHDYSWSPHYHNPAAQQQPPESPSSSSSSSASSSSSEMYPRPSPQRAPRPGSDNVIRREGSRLIGFLLFILLHLARTFFTD